ncbi:hypothetical protein [Pontibacter litorisediminis]|uniref:hypothetical protein n=1 Tax=Pontibacter litorisediminis TaxID=1846260 RepID=UPI0023EC8F07|nr:hypothetical protein [Pontibacter litorisediminis]
MKTYENLSNNSRGLIRGFLLILSAILTLLDLSSTYWVGLVHGALFVVVINELLMFWRARQQKAATTQASR